MEAKNMVPISTKRRWILARLLNIPPILFGLPAFSETSSQEHQVLQMLDYKSIDLVEYRSALFQYNQNFSQTVENFQETIPDIQQRINHLSRQAHYAPLSEKKGLLTLFCEYHILLAVILGEHKKFEATIELLTCAISIAEEYKLYDTWAYALRQRGVVYLTYGKLTAGLVHYEAAHPHFLRAAAEFDAIKTFETHLSLQRRAIVNMAAGEVYGRIAQNQQELSQAVKQVDLGGRMVGQGSDDISILDEGRYHLDKGSALIASPFKRFFHDAHREFEMAIKHTDEKRTLRFISISNWQAEAYFLEGLYPMATTYAEQTLELIGNNPSSQHLPRVENLSHRLRESSYGKNGEVTELSVEILKVQKPELFL